MALPRPPAAAPDRLGVCLLLALALHAAAILGVVFGGGTAARPDFELAWAPHAGDAGAAAGIVAAPAGDWPALPAGGLAAAAPGLPALERAYTRAWVEWTERAGRQRAPALAGAIEVAVTVDASGMVRRVAPGPGPVELAAAARRIVRLAQPYPPFPEGLRARREQLRIERRWLFDDAGLRAGLAPW